MAGVALLVVVGAGAWVVSSMIQGAEPEPPDTVSGQEGSSTPEEIGKRAEQGDAEAQWRYGVLFHTGDGVRQSDKEAIYWFERSAEQRFVPAASALGLQYWAGQGVPQNYNKAYFWYDVALEEGDSNAVAKLDELNGELTQDEVATVHEQATAWLQSHSQKEQHP